MKYCLLIAFFFILSCKSTIKTPPPAEVSKKASIQEPMYCNEIIEAKDLPDSLKLAPTHILSYRQKEGCVCIKYQYSGCLEGKAILAYDQKPLSESNRPEVNMKLMIMDAGNCDELLTDSTCFSMKKMQFIGNQVLVFLNSKDNNLLLNYEGVNR